MKLNKLFILAIICLCLLSCSLFEEQEVTACFTYTVEGDEIWDRHVVFDNCSKNADSYVWDFGDDNQSTKTNPTHDYQYDGVFTVTLEASNSTSTDTYTDTILVSWTMVEKPNIYLYPTETTDISVTLDFPESGYIVTSIPEYDDGWLVTAESDGIIDNTYDYLFYESVQPDVWQTEHGWCTSQDDLAGFFQTNMQAWNFNENEINDFIEYWIPRLTDFDYYAIYPQEKHLIEQVIEMDISPIPANLNRLFYLLEGSQDFNILSEPDIVPFDRTGFTVVEWGVILK